MTISKKPFSMPVGDETPKGYEAFADTEPAPSQMKVKAALVSQLASLEIAEIENLRARAIAPAAEVIGTVRENLSLRQELNILGNIDDSGKMLFRAYRDQTLVGYALIIIGWPDKCSWVIQHMIIDPELRLQGIGSAIIDKVEDYAESSSVEPGSLYAVPIEERGKDFWTFRGYTEVAGSYRVQIAGKSVNLFLCRKDLGSLDN
jgi:GNAT superfamily N-acetyltransferase